MTNLVLTHSKEHYHSNFSRRSSLMEEYKKNMLEYLQHMYPQVSIEILKRNLQQIITETYKPRMLKYLSSPSSGNIEAKAGELLEVTNSLNRDILTPYGATYVQVAERKAIFSEYIEDNQKERKAVKHRMFLAEARNDKDAVRLDDLRQKNIKTNINVLSGVMLSNVTFRSAINYNAITATSRFSIMTAYTALELALASNYYFYSEDRAINWIVSLLREYPGETKLIQCVQDYNLKQPSSEEVFNAYVDQIHQYMVAGDNGTLKELISHLSQAELTFIYYGVNIKRIFQENEHFRTLFQKLLDLSYVKSFEGEVPKVTKLPDEIVRTFAVIMLSKEIGKTTMEDIDTKFPELGRLLYSTYLYLEEHFKQLEPLFNTLIMLPVIPADISIHKNMIRRTVLLSDTDSVLFTNMDWIKWYAGNIKVSESTKNFNAFIVSLASKFLEHSFAYMSASMNVSVTDIKTIAIKNEFMYDLFMRTPISKHYAGYIRYREGVYQDPYKFDLKGKNFKGSDLCKNTTSYVKWFIKHIFNSYLETYELHPEDLISKVIIFEQKIKKSIDKGEVTFLTQKPINLKDQYINPSGSNYLYYELWQYVFAAKYGDFNLPQKSKELPINEVSIKNISQLDHMKSIDPEIYQKFIEFIKKTPKKVFSRVLIPIGFEIPKELISIANYRKVCAGNCYSLELILASFNITKYPNRKNKITLFSDHYQNILQEITDEQQNRITAAADGYDASDELYDEDDFDEEDWDLETEEVSFGEVWEDGF